MKRLLSFIVITLFFVPVLPMAHVFSADKGVIIKFASVAPKGSTWIKHMARLDKNLKEKTNGRLGFRIYAGGIAGDETDVLRKIRINQIHSTAFSGVGITRILPQTRILDLPFLFRNRDEIDRVLLEFFDYFQEKFTEKGFTLLSWVEVGDVYLFSKKPIKKIDDMGGRKIWTWEGDPVSKMTFSVMNCSTVPLSITDVRTALSTGMIDSFYGPPLGILSVQWFEGIDYMIAPPMAHSTGVLLISNSIMNKIPEDLAILLKAEVRAAMDKLSTELIAQGQEAFELIHDKNVEILSIDAPSDLNSFKRIHDVVAQRLSHEIYPGTLLQRMYALLERIRQNP